MRVEKTAGITVNALERVQSRPSWRRDVLIQRQKNFSVNRFRFPSLSLYIFAKPNAVSSEILVSELHVKICEKSIGFSDSNKKAL